MENTNPDIKNLDLQCPDTISFELIYKIIDIVIKPLQKTFDIASRNKEKQHISDLNKPGGWWVGEGG